MGWFLYVMITKVDGCFSFITYSSLNFQGINFTPMRSIETKLPKLKKQTNYFKEIRQNFSKKTNLTFFWNVYNSTVMPLHHYVS